MLGFLIRLGPVRGTLLITAAAMAASLLISIIAMGTLGRISLLGILISLGVPALLVPVNWFPFVRVSSQLEATHRKLVQSEDRYRSIMSQASDGIVLLDLDAEAGPVVAEANHAACTMHGYPKEEMIGLSLGRLEKPLPAEEDGRNRESLGKGEVVIFEAVHRRRDGTTYPAEVSSRIVSIGGRQHVLSIERDVTERKKTEEAIRKYGAKLKHSNQMQELFNDILSHDLLNPATIIAGACSRLSGKAGGATSSEVDMIARNCSKLIGLVNDAASLAKLENIETLETQGDDLGRLVASAIGSLHNDPSKSKVEILFESPGQVPVKVNRIFEEALINVISNAVKFSPDGSAVAVEISENGDSHLVSVADRGSGIPDALKELIFRRFTKVDKGNMKGSGLGLAIARRVVQLHGGRIWVEDNPGGGSVFRMSVPKKAVETSQTS